jgi:DNA-binding transcriptional MerR regulator
MMREDRGTMARFLGIYQLADCAKLLKAPRETVREWTVKGLAPSRQKGQRVSSAAYNFVDLVSLLVVRELRGRGIPLQRIRKAEEYLSASW